MRTRRLLTWPAWALVYASALAGQSPTGSLSHPDYLEAARAGTVGISVKSAEGEASGSGFIVDPTGIVVTAAHVLAGATSVDVQLASGQRLRVEGIVHFDATTDLAILKVAASNLPTVLLGSSADLRIGQRLYAIGSPLGLAQTMADGILSAERVDGERKLLQISIPVSPGSSGGPIVNEAGRVIGVVVSGIRGGGAENLNFALPVNYVREILPLVRGQTPRSIVTIPTTKPKNLISAAPLPADMPRRVNQNLDFRKLNGVEFFSDVPREEPNMRTLTTVRYITAQDAMGRPSIERIDAEVVEARANLFAPWVAQWRDEKREVIATDSSGRLESFFNRTSFRADVSSGRASAHVIDTLLTADLDPYHYTQVVPHGVMSTYGIGAAIAAAPDSSTFFHVWFMALDSARATMHSVRVEVLQAGRVKMKVPRDGQGCAAGGQRVDREVPARRVRLTQDATTEEAWIYAARPRVRLTPGDCVSFPGLK